MHGQGLSNGKVHDQSNSVGQADSKSRRMSNSNIPDGTVESVPISNTIDLTVQDMGK